MSIKSHFQKHKTTYLACGATAVMVSGVTYLLAKNGASLKIVGSPEVALPFTQTASIVGTHNTVNQTVVNFIERSTPSRPVGLLDESGNVAEVFHSIHDAARKTGHSFQKISKQINGNSVSLGGDTFTPLALAA